jgi:hypothetical protein
LVVIKHRAANKDSCVEPVVNPDTNIVQVRDENTNPGTEKLMRTPTFSEATRSLLAEPDVQAESSSSVEDNLSTRPQIETGADRIRHSIARSATNSMDGLQGLTSELQGLQRFLNSQVSRVQGEIDNALSGIKIIMDAIAPLKGPPVSLATPTTARPVRAGPAAQTEAAPRR